MTTVKSDQNIGREIPMFPNQGLFRVNMVDVDSLGENHKEFIKTINYRSSHPEVFLIKSVLKICSKFTGDNHAEA